MKMALTPASLSPVRLTRTVLLAALFGFLFRGYAVYSADDRQLHGSMAPFWEFVRGTGPAPFQYRPGVLRTAGWFYVHLHWPLRYGFSLLDLVGSSIALLLGYEILRRSQVFAKASLPLQWMASASYIALVLYLVCWQDFYKKPETQPAAALTVLLLFLWSSSGSLELRPSPGILWLTGGGILLLTLALSLVRADLALCVGLGALAAGSIRQRGDLSLPRIPALVTASLCVLLAASVQLLLMKVIYPHAAPYGVRVFMFPTAVRHPWRFAVFFAYTLPVFWTFSEAWRRRYTSDAAGLAMLFAAIPFLALWLTFGRLEEVRIFLPLAVSLAPLTTQLVTLRAAGA